MLRTGLRGTSRPLARSILARGYAKKAATKKAEEPKADARQIAQSREREQKRLQAKRDIARAYIRLKEEANAFTDMPHTMDIVDAMRYIRAAEVGRPAHATTVSLSMRIVAERGVPKVTGACRLPHPLDEERICVLTSVAELAEEARRAGASVVGGDEIINDIKAGGPIDFDRMYATPDIMNRVSQIGRILGPKGLMPNVKRGTVTDDVYNSIMAAKGEMTFKQVDDMLTLPIARASFSDTDIVRNIIAVTDTIRDLLANVPAAKKGQIGRTLISSSVSPCIAVQV